MATQNSDGTVNVTKGTDTRGNPRSGSMTTAPGPLRSVSPGVGRDSARGGARLGTKKTAVSRTQR